MKELEFINPLAMEIAKPKPPLTNKHIGSHTMCIDGGKLYEYDPQTGEITEATYRTETDLVYGQEVKRKLDLKAGMRYVEALNHKNALKKVKQQKFIK